MMTWTDEKLAALPPAKLEIVRQNAVRAGQTELVRRIEALQQARRPHRAVSGETPVIGFHFVCPEDYEVTLLPNGQFSSGIWYVKENHCEPALQMRGYVALHHSRSSLSHRQGTIVGWKPELRTKGKKQHGITFVLEPFDDRLRWYGEATGERGYRRVSDPPPWTPKI